MERNRGESRNTDIQMAPIHEVEDLKLNFQFSFFRCINLGRVYSKKNKVSKLVKYALMK